MRLLQVSCIIHAPTEANTAAHAIANFVARAEGRFQWFEVGPPWLMQIIDCDRPVTNIYSMDARRSSSFSMNEDDSTASRSFFM
jgi:hypothetical protein